MSYGQALVDQLVTSGGDSIDLTTLFNTGSPASNLTKKYITGLVFHPVDGVSVATIGDTVAAGTTALHGNSGDWSLNGIVTAAGSITAFNETTRTATIGGTTYSLTLQANIRKPTVAAAVADTNIPLWSIVETVSYFAGWDTTITGPVGGNTYLVVPASSGTTDGGSFIDMDSGYQLMGLFLDGKIQLTQFGGIPGTDTANATANATALTNAITYVAGPVNTFEGGSVDLGAGNWVFGTITLDELWGWHLIGHNQTVTLTGAFNITGCAGFTVSNMFVEAETQFNNDGFVFDVGSSSGERNHNFVFWNVTLSDFDNGHHAVGDISQCWFVGGQYGGSNKSIYFESGFTADHVYFIDPIFSNHAASSTAFDCRCNNWELINAHFETNHGDSSTYDIHAEGQQYRITGGEMTASGGIYLSSNNGRLSDMTINNSAATYVINANSGENEITGNTIRWATNDGSASDETDGAGKTAIYGSGVTKCDDNNIRRPGTGVHLTGSKVSATNNYINDPATYGYYLQSATDVKINGGTLVLTKSAAVGVNQTGTGTGCAINDINWSVSAGTKYAFAGGVPTIRDSDEDTPNGNYLGGPGSMYTRLNNAVQGRTNYVKSTTATSTDGWIPQGLALSTTTDLNSSSSDINTEDKLQGVGVLNTDTNVVVYPAGTSATDVWYDAAGNSVNTPS